MICESKITSVRPAENTSLFLKKKKTTKDIKFSCNRSKHRNHIPLEAMTMMNLKILAILYSFWWQSSSENFKMTQHHYNEVHKSRGGIFWTAVTWIFFTTFDVLMDQYDRGGYSLVFYRKIFRDFQLFPGCSLHF